MGNRQSNDRVVNDKNLSSATVIYKKQPFLEYQPIVEDLVSPVAFIDHPAMERMFAVDQTGIIYLYDPKVAEKANRVSVDPQVGTIYHFENNEQQSEPPFLNIADLMVPLNPNYDERGLLDLTFHPTNKNLFYLWYSGPPTQKNYSHDMILQEWLYNAQTGPVQGRELVRWPHLEMNHNGGKIQFDVLNKNVLFLSVGDEGGQGDQHGQFGNAQNLESPWGKIWAFDIDDSGEIVSEPKMYGYGWRNPWRYAFDANGNMIVGDVGQYKWEGLHLVSEPGENHGWRAYENGHVYDKALADRLAQEGIQITFPFFYYGRDIGGSVIAGYPLDDNRYIFGDFLTTENYDNVFILDRDILYIQPKVHDRARFVNSFAQDHKDNVYVLAKSEAGPQGQTGVIYQIMSIENES